MRTNSNKQTKPTNFLRWIGLGGVLTLLFILLKGGTKSPSRGAEPKEIASYLIKKLKSKGANPEQIKVIVGQSYHETGGFTSELARDYANIFGISNHVTSLGVKTDSGFLMYPNYENCIEDYFAILTYYINTSQTQPPSTFIGFATWLKENHYYTDSLTNYANGMINGWKQTALMLNIQ